MSVNRESSTHRAQHWNDIYERRGSTGVSWFQAAPSTSMALITSLHLTSEAAIIDVGGGASSLVDSLLEAGFNNLTVLDVSESALAASRERLSSEVGVTWLNDDLLAWQPKETYALWHDRAVFHFLIDANERQKYLRVLCSAVDVGGYVVIGTFAEDGPSECSGLPIVQYSSDKLAATLGDNFDLIETHGEMHVTPSGAQQSFTWLVARLTKK
jgi:hypothetical protein